jgi:alpha-tubulin suppressor-like RCC1 family protein
MLIFSSCDNLPETQIEVEEENAEASILNFQGISSFSDLNATSVKLNWHPVIWALGYHIYHIEEGAQDNGRLIAATDGNAKSYIITGLRPDSEYQFLLKAVDFYGDEDANTTRVRFRTRPMPRSLVNLHGTSKSFCAHETLGNTVKCWGQGQLIGNQDQNIGDTPDELGDAIAKIEPRENLFKIKRLYNGPNNVCFAADIHPLPVFCLGDNSKGTLGIESDIDAVSSIEQLKLIDPINTGANERIHDMGLGLYFACAKLNNGKLKCWGDNSFGQLGLGNSNSKGRSAGDMGDNLPYVNLPDGTQVVKLAVGDNHVCVLLDDQTVRCWGDNQYGQLGVGSTQNVGSDPAHMSNALKAVNFGEQTPLELVANGNSTCALLTNGLPACWGQNNDGKLGLGHTDPVGDSIEEVEQGLQGVDLGPGINATHIAGMKNGFCALTNTHQISCWGGNDKGQLGIESDQLVSFEPTFVKIPEQLAFIGIARNSYGKNMCGLLYTQEITCWGENAHGELAQGDTLSRGGFPDEMSVQPPLVNLGAFLPGVGNEQGDFLGGDFDNIAQNLIPPTDVTEICKTDLTQLSQVLENYLSETADLNIIKQNRIISGSRIKISDPNFDLIDKSLKRFSFETHFPTPFETGDMIELEIYNSVGCINNAPLDYRLIFKIQATEVTQQIGNKKIFKVNEISQIDIQNRGFVTLNTEVKPYICTLEVTEVDDTATVKAGCDLQINTSRTRLIASVSGQLGNADLELVDTVSTESLTISETGQFQLNNLLFYGQSYNLEIASNSENISCSSENSTGVLSETEGSNIIQINCHQKSCLDPQYQEFPSTQCPVVWDQDNSVQTAVQCALDKNFIHDISLCQTILPKGCLDPIAINTASSIATHDPAVCVYQRACEQGINISSQAQNWSVLPYNSASAHPEVISYKIKKLDGSWSQDYYPGVNDLDPDHLDAFNGSGRHMWSYFSEREHQITYCDGYESNPEGQTTLIQLQNAGDANQPVQIVYIIDPKQSMAEHRGNLLKISSLVLEQLKDSDIQFFAYSSADGKFMQNNQDSFEARILNRQSDNSYTWNYTLAPSLLENLIIKKSDSLITRQATLGNLSEQILSYVPTNNINIKTKPLCLIHHLIDEFPHDNPIKLNRPDPTQPMIVINSSDVEDRISSRNCIKNMRKVPFTKYGYRNNYVRVAVTYTYSDKKGNLKSRYKFLYRKSDLENFNYSSLSTSNTTCPQDLINYVSTKGLFSERALSGTCSARRNDYSRFLSDQFLKSDDAGLDLCTNSFKYRKKEHINLKAYMQSAYKDFVFTDHCFKSELGTTRTIREYYGPRRSQSSFITDLGEKLQLYPKLIIFDQINSLVPARNIASLMTSPSNCLPPSGAQLLLQNSAIEGQVITLNNCENLESAFSADKINYSQKFKIKLNKVRVEIGLGQKIESVYVSNNRDIFNIPLNELGLEMISPSIMEITFTNIARGHRYMIVGLKDED